MTSYKLEARLPSCFVTVEMIGQIETYILQRADDVFGVSADQIRNDYSVTVAESIGKETLESVRSFNGSKFADTTESVTLALVSYAPRRDVTVHLNRASYLSRIEVVVERSDAREAAIGMRDGVMALIEPHKTFAWLFHPPPAVHGALFVLFPLAIITLAARNWNSGSDEVTGVLAAMMLIVGLTGFSYHIGVALTDYTEFDSRRVAIRRRVRSWACAGLATFLVFGTVLASVRDFLFGT